MKKKEFWIVQYFWNDGHGRVYFIEQPFKTIIGAVLFVISFLVKRRTYLLQIAKAADPWWGIGMAGRYRKIIDGGVK